MKKYVYPKLPARICSPFFRIAGNGLANCLFVAARAWVRAKKENLELIEPTWLNFCIGPYLRRQQDKRHYCGLFRPCNGNHGWKKVFLLCFRRSQIVVEEGLGRYFEDILDSSEMVREYLLQIVRPELLKSVNAFDFADTVAVHIRLSDAPAIHRTPLEWYKGAMEDLQRQYPAKNLRFLIFSDGTDAELAPVLCRPNTRRVFFGNAIADIFAISRCHFLIGSDSTFSGWGAYLGQVPSLFHRKHYGRVLADGSKEKVVNDR